MSREYTYVTKFFLSNPVLDIEKAREYLTEDDMTQYFIPHHDADLVEKITHIEWKLQTEDRGEIIVKTNALLTDEECEIISDWISSQNSDGLGEGFETREFANYDANRYDDYGYEISALDLGYNYEECWVMASFDWATNNYKLELQD